MTTKSVRTDILSKALAHDVISIEASVDPEAFSEREDKLAIAGVVLHCMGVDLKTSLHILTGRAGLPVSAHYFIPQVSAAQFLQEVGAIYDLGAVKLQYPDKIPIIQIVAPTRVAHHAGKSKWSNWNKMCDKCAEGLNQVTLGIEVHCPGYANGLSPDPAQFDFDIFVPYHPAQGDVVSKLTRYLLEHHKIEPTQVVAHSTIAPGRKTDPGPLFPWKQLAEQGIGRYVSATALAKAAPLTDEDKKTLRLTTVLSLKELGYDVAAIQPGQQDQDQEFRKVVRSYFMQFDPTYYSTYVALKPGESLDPSMERVIKGVRSLLAHP